MICERSCQAISDVSTRLCQNELRERETLLECPRSMDADESCDSGMQLAEASCDGTGTDAEASAPPSPDYTIQSCFVAVDLDPAQLVHFRHRLGKVDQFLTAPSCSGNERAKSSWHRVLPPQPLSPFLQMFQNTCIISEMRFQCAQMRSTYFQRRTTCIPNAFQ